MNIFHFYFILLLIEIIQANEKIYKIPFGLFNHKASEDVLNIINNICYNRIYLNLSIGTPPQILPFELDTKSQTFCISTDYFAKNKSTSYISLSKEIYYYNEDVENGFDSKDILNINDNTNKKINFILATKFPFNKKNILGILGLNIPRFVKIGVYPFFRSLKEAELINSYTWTLKYFDNISLFDQITFNKNKDNIIGEFIFGDDPNNYENNKNKYNDKEFFKVSPLSSAEAVYWGIEFNNIYIKSKESQNNSKIFFTEGKKAEIVINFSFMMGPEKFFEFIKTNFFSQYISKGVCSEKNVNSYYTYIECDNNNNFKIESFPDIIFEHKAFETWFNLTYKDLFVEDDKNKKYIFLILKKDYVTNWVLGTVFLRKFQLVFNEDLKTIGYYRQPGQYYEEINDDINNGKSNGNLNEMNKQSKAKKIFIIILIIIFSFLLIFLGMIIQRKYFSKNRKIRANELEENFSYEGKEKNDKDNNKLMINE